MISIDGAFWIVLTGALATGSCALLGAFLVLRKMSLLGDALSHAVLPGIAIAFLFTDSRAIVPMFVGAAACGLVTTFLVETFHRKWNVQEDASIGIVFTALFALGVVIITVFAGQIDLDQECVLYGEIAYTPWDVLIVGDVDYGPRPVWILGGVFLLDLLFVLLFYKELKIASFDSAMAVAVGINATLMHYLLMGAVSLTTVAAFESVGAILVVAMLIVPGATAYLWSDKLHVILVLSVCFGVASALGGYWMASLWDSSIAGAMVAVVGAIFFVSLLLSPNQGVVARIWQRIVFSVQVAQDHMLLALARRAEVEEQYRFSRDELMEMASVWRGVAALALRRLERRALVERQNGYLYLAAAGRQEALRLLRNHRLWETYLSGLGLPEDHVHDPADAVEHFIGRELAAELDAEVEVQTDPQGKRIPPPE
ncbi:MAG: manganese/zinc/iron transport system permease protein [Candidatus Latescibacterota bacterium]|jgi:manganese/zinc/iron transport system permease protein